MASGRPRSQGFARQSRKVTLLDHTGADRISSVDALIVAGMDADTTALSVAQGVELDSAEIDAARNRALRLLGYRERSIHEVSSRLQEDGYPPQVVESVVDRMIELGLVDDSRFAEQFVRSKTTAGWGRARIRRALSEHLVEEIVVTDALAQWAPEEEEADRALAALRNTSVQSRKDRERALRRLISKGFTFSQAKDAVSRLEGAGDTD